MTGPVNIQAEQSGLDIRIEVNPNAYHGDRSNPQFYIARFRDATAIPVRGDVVTVIQPDDDPTADFVSTAVVDDIDHERRLIMLHVDWKGFHDVQPNRKPVTDRSLTVNFYRGAVLVSA
jgi:hypothetical protein